MMEKEENDSGSNARRYALHGYLRSQKPFLRHSDTAKEFRPISNRMGRMSEEDSQSHPTRLSSPSELSPISHVAPSQYVLSWQRTHNAFSSFGHSYNQRLECYQTL